MKKQKEEKVEFLEEEIEAAIRYLKTNTTTYPSRENAINHLRIMQGTAHIAAHKIVEDIMSDKFKEKKLKKQS